MRRCEKTLKCRGPGLKLRQVGITTIEALAVTLIREITDKSDMGLRRRFK
jgi:hypothetical protein